MRLGLGAAVLGLPAARAESRPVALRARPIPASGELLPVIGLGTSRTFDVDPDSAEMSGLQDVLQAFVEAGATVIDTSPMYGRSEAVVGRLVADLDVSSHVFMATKVWTPEKKYWPQAEPRQRGIEQMDESFALLGRQQLDLMQVHNLVSWQEHLETLREWQEAGRIRYLGITHSRDMAFGDVEKILLAEKLDFLQINYSLAERGAADRLLPLCVDRGVAVLINRPFQKGALFKAVEGQQLPSWAADFEARTWGQFFLKYVLANPAVSCVIPATRKLAHMEDNLEAGRGALPDSEQLKKMQQLLTSL